MATTLAQSHAANKKDQQSLCRHVEGLGWLD
jgi:hypothetical protein